MHTYNYLYPNAMATGMVYFAYTQDFLISSVIYPTSGSRPIAKDNGVSNVIAHDSDLRQALHYILATVLIPGLQPIHNAYVCIVLCAGPVPVSYSHGDQTLLTISRLVGHSTPIVHVRMHVNKRYSDS